MNLSMRSSDVSNADLTIDAKGFDCPLPLLKLKMGLNRLLTGEVIQVLTTDKASVKDFTVYCDYSEHKLLGIQEKSDCFVIRVEKGE